MHPYRDVRMSAEQGRHVRLFVAIRSKKIGRFRNYGLYRKVRIVCYEPISRKSSYEVPVKNKLDKVVENG